MGVGAIIYSRMSSARLPGKALMDIGGRPLIGHVIDRARRVDGLEGVVLATTKRAEDDPLADFARTEGIPVWRGSRDNLVERGFECARAYGWTSFARVCGDRVFMDPKDLRRGSERMTTASDRVDLVTNRLSGAVPPGLTVEVVRTAALERVLAGTDDPEDLEHVTPYIYRHPERFSIAGIPAPPPHSRGLRYVVDTPRDLARARAVVERLYAPAEGSSKTLARLIREWEWANPELHAIT